MWLSLPDPFTCPIGTAHVRDGPPYWTTTYGNSNRTLDTVAFGKAEKEPREMSYCYYNVTSLLFNNSFYWVLLFGVKYIVRISEKWI